MEEKITCLLCNYLISLKTGDNEIGSDKYEKAFGDFLDSEEYEINESDPFALARAAFKYGWKSASLKP